MKKKLSPSMRALGIAVWIVAWQLAAIAIGKPLLLPGPVQVIDAMNRLWHEGQLGPAVAQSVMQIGAGFLLSVLLGMTAGALSHKFALFRAIADPVIRFLRSVPIAALVVLLLLWFSIRTFGLLLVLLAGLPLVYESILDALDRGDPPMEEVARVHRWPAKSVRRAIRRPMIERALRPVLRHLAGFSWKAGVSAQVFARAPESLGNAIAQAKLALSTDEVFAVVAVVCVASALCGWLVERLVLACFVTERRTRAVEGGASIPLDPEVTGAFPPFERARDLILDDVTLGYGEYEPVRHWTKIIPAGRTCKLRGPSGIGKTTVLKAVLGLIEPRHGSIEGGFGTKGVEVGVAFQEPRLVGWMSARENLSLADWEKERVDMAMDQLRRWGVADTRLPVSSFSGGMRQKVSLVRALFSPGSLVVLDEPYQGLDADSRIAVFQATEKLLRYRTALIATHWSEEEILRSEGVAGLLAIDDESDEEGDEGWDGPSEADSVEG